jgi:hypothetical protein
MVSLTLSVNEELKAKMDAHPEMNWSEVARRAIMEKIEDLEFMKTVRAKSRLNTKDAKAIGSKIDKGMTRRFSETVKRYGRSG